MNNETLNKESVEKQTQTNNKKTNPIVKWFRNVGCGVMLLVILAAGGYVYWKYYSVFGEGVKSGTLNYVVLKGDIFKTYEGKLIMEGVVSSGQGQIESNHFTFSIEDEDLAQKLMRMSGEKVELKYKEYHGKLPWRGHSVYVVDSILSHEEDNDSGKSTEETIVEVVSTSI